MYDNRSLQLKTLEEIKKLVFTKLDEVWLFNKEDYKTTEIDIEADITNPLYRSLYNFILDFYEDITDIEFKIRDKVECIQYINLDAEHNDNINMADDCINIKLLKHTLVCFICKEWIFNMIKQQYESDEEYYSTDDEGYNTDDTYNSEGSGDIDLSKL